VRSVTITKARRARRTRRVRRTQEERSTATRTALLDATLECLEVDGYAHTTTTRIARQAGVSRGAQLHHFPTKIELVTEAVAHLFARRHAEFLDAFARLPAEAVRVEAAIDLLWEMFRGPTFVIWLELAVAARTDPELAEPVQRMTGEFFDLVERTFLDLFVRQSTSNPYFDIAPRFAFALLEGLALSRLHGPEDANTDAVVDAAKSIARLVMPPQPTVQRGGTP
jgi:AcrR family transcriptional regulator